MKIIGFPHGSWIIGLGPIIIAGKDRKRIDDWEINYYNILWKQQIELLVIGWVLVLIIEFLFKWEKKEISLIKEANYYMKNLAYPRFRPLFNWVNFIKQESILY